MTNVLFLLEQGHYQGILFPDEHGVPTVPVEESFVTRAAYVHPERIEESDIAAKEIDLNQGHTLLLFQVSPDGPPRRCARCFTWQETVRNASWRDQTSHHGATLQRYASTTTLGPWSWLSDHRQQRDGYFLTGIGSQSELWRIERIETDSLANAVFTLLPVRLLGGLSPADFSSIANGLLRAELKAQYDDLLTSIAQHAFRDVVTKSRNIVEGIIAAKLGLLDGQDRLFTGLETIGKLLNDRETRDTCGWTFLQYHVAHKLRLMHGQTHATTKTPLRPEYALSVIEDLNFLLREWGYTR
jgi:hypothetical protein